jgi:hypothetical protein
VREEDVADLREPEGLDEAEHDAGQADPLLVTLGVDGENGVRAALPPVALLGDHGRGIRHLRRPAEDPADDLRVVEMAQRGGVARGPAGAE